MLIRKPLVLFLPDICNNVVNQMFSNYEKVSVKAYFIENYNAYFGKT